MQGQNPKFFPLQSLSVYECHYEMYKIRGHHDNHELIFGQSRPSIPLCDVNSLKLEDGRFPKTLEYSMTAISCEFEVVSNRKSAILIGWVLHNYQMGWQSLSDPNAMCCL